MMMQYEYYNLCPFYVIDEIEPIATCDDQLNVSVGSAGGDSGYGYARVYAADIDEGSWDNCSPVGLVTRRFVKEADIETFEAATGIDLDEMDTAPLSKPGTSLDGERGVFTPWADYVDFICIDAHNYVLIELGVWDDANMDGYFNDEVVEWHGLALTDNFNKCWLEVLVEDKIAPICEAPHAVTVKCSDVPYYATLPEDGAVWADLSESEQDNIKRWFGELQDEHNTYPKAWDNCYAEVEMIDVEFDLICGTGTVTRTFQAYEVKADGTRGRTSEYLYSGDHIDSLPRLLHHFP